jgi:DNA mismatch endonuclease, patch repair protein
MADIVSREVRSRMMSGIKGKNTKPELLIRKGLHRLGFRFRLHDKSLPGKPDIVLPRHRAVVFVHGCFWHGHDCHLFKWPATRMRFWQSKILRNKQLDLMAETSLLAAGWRCAVVWECALKGRHKLSLPLVIERCADWIRSGSNRLELHALEQKTGSADHPDHIVGELR